jgi:hypothetical protein
MQRESLRTGDRQPSSLMPSYSRSAVIWLHHDRCDRKFPLLPWRLSSIAASRRREDSASVSRKEAEGDPTRPDSTNSRRRSLVGARSLA